MIEFDSVTTRGGDLGESALFNGERLQKDDVIFIVLGDLDELTSVLGLAEAILRRECPKEKRLYSLIESIQRDLIRVGGQVATPERDPLYVRLDTIADKDVETLEQHEKKYMKDIEVPRRFILPGATEAGGFLDLGRAVCRRAERSLVSCIRVKHSTKLDDCRCYLNRLSDLLFVIARWIEKCPIPEPSA